MYRFLWNTCSSGTRFKYIAYQIWINTACVHLTFGSKCTVKRIVIFPLSTCMRIFLFSASKRKVICEDSKTTLSCPSNQVIKITQATYGRSNKRTCKHPNMKTTRCVTKKPLGISRKNCNGRKSCIVAANNRLYGDPCPGTYKYVTVTYSCKGMFVNNTLMSWHGVTKLKV